MHHPPPTPRLYPGLYLSPGVRYSKSVKGKNYFYDVGNPLRFFLHTLYFFSNPLFRFFYKIIYLVGSVGLGQVGQVG